MVNDSGWTQLHFCAKYGNLKKIETLADKGTNIHLKTDDGDNCLHIAALFGHVDLCKTLVKKHNFDVHEVNNNGWTALHFSAQGGSYELVNFFIANGSYIYHPTDDGENCLHVASLYGHFHLCKTLVNKHKVDVHEANDNGWTPLHFSAQRGSDKLMHFFVNKGADIHVLTNSGQSCLHIGALYGHLELCKTLVNKYQSKVNETDNKGRAALHFSAKIGSYNLITFFIDKGSNISLRTNDGKNCLHIAAKNGHVDLCQILMKKYKFDVHETSNDGWTVLHFSSQGGSDELVKFFADKGTDIQVLTNSGQNCLHIAALYGHFGLCKTFLNDCIFDVNIADNDGWTALLCSAKSGNFALFTCILEKSSEIYCKTNKMENVLHLCAHNGHFDICEFVLKYFTTDYKNNNTNKQYALNGKLYKSQIFYKYNAIFLHAMDADGNTYLHLAADGNQFKVCKLLLKYDTDILTLLNQKGESAREIAKKSGYKDVLNSLKAYYDRIGMLLLDF